MILDALDAAGSASDMNLHSLHFHALKGDMKGLFAVTVRANWRIVFAWHDGAINVDLVDYH